MEKVHVTVWAASQKGEPRRPSKDASHRHKLRRRLISSGPRKTSSGVDDLTKELVTRCLISAVRCLVYPPLRLYSQWEHHPL